MARRWELLYRSEAVLAFRPCTLPLWGSMGPDWEEGLEKWVFFPGCDSAKNDKVGMTILTQDCLGGNTKGDVYVQSSLDNGYPAVFGSAACR